MATLRSALRGEDPAGVRGLDPALVDEVIALAESHSVTALLYGRLGSADDPRCVRARRLVADRALTCARQLYRLTFFSADLVRSLSDAGVESVLLKGSGVAALYPVPEYRKSGDVDLLLADPSRVGLACEALRRCGLTVVGEQDAHHHVSMRSPQGIEVELHVAITEDFDSDGLNRVVARCQAEAVRHVRAVRLLGCELPVLEDAYQALSLLLHMLQHFLRAGFGLKLLCDWVEFWARDVDPEQVDAYLRLVDACGLEGFSRVVTSACVRRLGLEESTAVVMLEGGRPLDERLVDDFLREVFDAGEFGHSSSERMVALRGSSLVDVAREFHHQTRLNFPRACRCPVAWPVLWAATLARFLRNNRRVRGTTTGDVIAEARRRGDLVRRLGLFGDGAEGQLK